MAAAARDPGREAEQCCWATGRMAVSVLSTSTNILIKMQMATLQGQQSCREAVAEEEKVEGGGGGKVRREGQQWGDRLLQSALSWGTVNPAMCMWEANLRVAATVTDLRTRAATHSSGGGNRKHACARNDPNTQAHLKKANATGDGLWVPAPYLTMVSGLYADPLARNLGRTAPDSLPATQ